MTHKIAAIVGSLRKASFTRKVARAIEALTPELAFEYVEIGDVDLYNQDLEETPPASWVALRDALRGADGYLFATPEYNRSIPGVLKNAIDVASRPYGKSAFGAGKPAAIVSVSPGAIGAFGANHHLRQCCVFLDLLPMAQPEAYVGGAAKLFDDAGAVTNPDTKALLEKFGKSFARWVALHVKR
ncbi:MAG TPA: NAD(P)H-dependent oxidoreductase [Byssovorax sp.]|jgi:chromate reductase